MRPSPRQRRAIACLLDLPGAARRLPGATIAAAARYSPSRLRALSRDALGETPAARQRRRRLDAAACALLRGSRTVARLALDAGFASPEAFHRAFRARYGCTPRDFARSGPPARAPRAFAIGAGITRLFQAAPESHHG